MASIATRRVAGRSFLRSATTSREKFASLLPALQVLPQLQSKVRKSPLHNENVHGQTTAGRMFSSMEVSDHSHHDNNVNNDSSGGTPPRLLENGSAVEMSFPAENSSSEAKSVFHAPWLWYNDPAFIHPSSGQRMRTLGQYPGCKIEAAQIVSLQELLQEKKEKDLPTVAQHPPPPGCLHSIGTVYKTENNKEVKSERENSKILKVTWDTIDPKNKTPLVSYYDWRWLQRCSYDDDARNKRNSNSRILPRDALGRHSVCAPILEIGYHDLFDENNNANNAALLEILDGIANQGAVLVKQSPLEPFLELGDKVAREDEDSSPVAKVGRALGGGYLSHGALYGDVFHVQNMPRAHNIAYTPMALSPHQDLAYFESKPGLQLLHCIRNRQDKIKGGESTLVDAVAAAEYLREVSPEHFDALCRSHGTWIKQREGADMFYTRPFIVLGDHGQVISVTWSPAFEGPPLAIAADEMERFVEAYAAFERMLDDNCFLSTENKISAILDHNLDAELQEYAYDFTWERNLEPGDMLIFNNQRMLHGRRGFEVLDLNDDSEEVYRHMMGCYTNIDDTINTYRMLLRDLPDRDKRVVRCFGNGSGGSP